MRVIDQLKKDLRKKDLEMKEVRSKMQERIKELERENEKLRKEKVGNNAI